MPHRPRLRDHLLLLPLDARRQRFVLRDRLRLSPVQLRLAADEASWLPLFDGRLTTDEVASRANAAPGRVADLVRYLDEGLFLDTDAYRRLLHAPVRPPSCLGVYEEEPAALRRQLAGLFAGTGLPGPPRPDGSLRAVLLPHMDYHRGGRVYAPGFKALVERNAARLFVIVATSHHSAHRFTLTRKHFQSPLGVVETDQPFIDRLVTEYGDGLFDDEALAHFPEHSVELEVVLLQFLYPHTPFRIVPLVVGSLGDCIRAGRDPLEAPDVARMVAALQAAERRTVEPVCWLISGDLAHLGPKFGDARPVYEQQLRHSAARDRLLLRWATTPDPEAYYRAVAEERDARRVCGLTPTYLTLAATRPSRGRVLAYEQFVAADRSESVGFAAAVFER